MKIELFCSVCDNNSPVEVEVNETNMYELTCSKGHKSKCFVQVQKFELLFELGAYALLDGYTREAVSSFAVAIERLHEYCINILMIKNGASKELREQTFKMVSVNSERQLGAFYYLYVNEFQEPPEQISRTRVTFRNAVTHKGKIPTYDETIEYAEYVFGYMIRLLQKLRSMENISTHELQHYNDYQLPPYDCKDTSPSNIPSGKVVLSMIGTSSGNKDYSDKDFKLQLEQLKQRERWLYN
ncbi:hypothetical protein [Bacillus siamensis]|uniref:hypothetical protein n=1 Tax=Bacillus siamensis TaxID=659243 RepID=UPI002230FE35|nr:hypothetical protein [Bacillus siamensis]UZD72425.1 hypothetical protein OM992_11340 [Bacillus siamensis]